MPTALRDIYLSLVFLLCAGAIFAPYLGYALPGFDYQIAGGKSVNMPVTVTLYALFLVVAIVALTQRLLGGQKTSEDVDAG